MIVNTDVHYSEARPTVPDFTDDVVTPTVPTVTPTTPQNPSVDPIEFMDQTGKIVWDSERSWATVQNSFSSSYKSGQHYDYKVISPGYSSTVRHHFSMYRDDITVTAVWYSINSRTLYNNDETQTLETYKFADTCIDVNSYDKDDMYIEIKLPQSSYTYQTGSSLYTPCLTITIEYYLNDEGEDNTREANVNLRIVQQPRAEYPVKWNNYNKYTQSAPNVAYGSGNQFSITDTVYTLEDIDYEVVYSNSNVDDGHLTLSLNTSGFGWSIKKNNIPEDIVCYVNLVFEGYIHTNNVPNTFGSSPHYCYAEITQAASADNGTVVILNSSMQEIKTDEVSFDTTSYYLYYIIYNGATVSQVVSTSNDITFGGREVAVPNSGIYKIKCTIPVNDQQYPKTRTISVVWANASGKEFVSSMQLVQKYEQPIYFEPNLITIDRNGNVTSTSIATLNIGTNTLTTFEIPDDSYEWYTISYANDSFLTNPILHLTDVSTNISTSYRMADITVTCTLQTQSGNTIYRSATLSLSQDPGLESEEIPSWKDSFYEVETEYFRLLDIDTNKILYTGKIYAGASKQINVTELVKDNFDINKYPFNNTVTKMNKYINIELQTSNSPETFESIKAYHIFWDYSYDYNLDRINGDYDWYSKCDWFSRGQFFSYKGNFWNPIAYYDPRQFIIMNFGVPFGDVAYTISEGMEIKGLFETDDEDVIDVLITIHEDKPSGDNYIATFRPQSAKTLYVTNGTRWSQRTYTIAEMKCSNANYCVYYMNLKGMWCWMLFEGKQVESSSLIQSKSITSSDSSNPYNIENGVYNNKITESFELTTCYLTDEASKKLKDLYHSPLVYVHDLENDIIHSVYVDTKSYTVKTFRNQGRKMFTHNIKLTKSITKNISL